MREKPVREKPVKVAVVQAAPVVFDRDATIEKTARLAAEASEKGAELILFPEAFVPAYPRGLSFGIVVGSRTPEGRRTWQRYWENAVEVPSVSTERLGEIAKDAGALLAIGVIERDPSGTLYCTLLYFGPDGTLLGKHRKLKPTAAERLIWGEGDGSTLTVLDTELGKIGGLICWENYMPLARMAMYSKLPPTRATHGKRRCVTSRVKAAPSFSAAISFLPSRCIPRIWRASKISRTSPRSCAAAAAQSSRRSAK